MPEKADSLANSGEQPPISLRRTGSKSIPTPGRKIVILIICVLLLISIVPIAIYRFVAPPTTPLMIIRARQGYHIEHQWVSLRAMAPAIRRAAIHAEDNEFCHERIGVDFEAFDRQVRVWIHGRHPTGASTITMQTARNLFLWPNRSYIRKVLELWITPQIAFLWPKHRILEVYLNIVEFGPGIFGVQAAAQHYFGKNASQLSVIEATRLVEVLPDPLHRTPSTLAPDDQRRAQLATLPVFMGDPEFNCGNP
jgi:monofunctional biosynthetic peptidoglycan transglycosylase